MSLIRWQQKQNDPIKELFNDDFLWGFPFVPVTGKPLTNGQSFWQPAIDVAEDKESFILKADLPGLKKEDIHVGVEDGVLTIQGERKSETDQKEKGYHRVERSYGRFVRSLNLGTAVDESKIKANYKDGVLEITVPKAEKAKAKSIDISVN
ncbi:MAG: Hsp20/alpha crystallin family protein [Candidatus Omnitrophica bacterium]|nr:Hsp20/alpha crystallin family protein [Candidatus Omnitrophota bacterium]